MLPHPVSPSLFFLPSFTSLQDPSTLDDVLLKAKGTSSAWPSGYPLYILLPTSCSLSYCELPGVVRTSLVSVPLLLTFLPGTLNLPVLVKAPHFGTQGRRSLFPRWVPCGFLTDWRPLSIYDVCASLSLSLWGLNLGLCTLCH